MFFNLTFFPMHIIGVGGQMRRIYNPMQYEFLQHQQHWNVLITIGALAARHRPDPLRDQLLLVAVRGQAKAPLNPWNANTLEWTAPSPPPHLNWGPTLPTGAPRPLRVQLAGLAEDFLPQWRRRWARPARGPALIEAGIGWRTLWRPAGDAGARRSC